MESDSNKMVVINSQDVRVKPSLSKIEWMQLLTRLRNAHFNYIESLEVMDAAIAYHSSISPFEIDDFIRKNPGLKEVKEFVESLRGVLRFD